MPSDQKYHALFYTPRSTLGLQIVVHQTHEKVSESPKPNESFLLPKKRLKVVPPKPLSDLEQARLSQKAYAEICKKMYSPAKVPKSAAPEKTPEQIQAEEAARFVATALSANVGESPAMSAKKLNTPPSEKKNIYVKNHFRAPPPIPTGTFRLKRPKPPTHKLSNAMMVLGILLCVLGFVLLAAYGIGSPICALGFGLLVGGPTTSFAGMRSKDKAIQKYNADVKYYNSRKPVSKSPKKSKPTLLAARPAVAVERPQMSAAGLIVANRRSMAPVKDHKSDVMPANIQNNLPAPR